MRHTASVISGSCLAILFGLFSACAQFPDVGEADAEAPTVAAQSAPVSQEPSPASSGPVAPKAESAQPAAPPPADQSSDPAETPPTVEQSSAVPDPVPATPVPAQDEERPASGLVLPPSSADPTSPPASPIAPKAKPATPASPPAATSASRSSAASSNAAASIGAQPAPPITGPAWLKGCKSVQRQGTVIMCDADTLLAPPSDKVQVYTRDPRLVPKSGGMGVRESLPAQYRLFILQ
ncbi:hypothetical protein [Viridibacterium curvum]|uniref:Uncharacterized protein n=1 Tax=Viridibacterium curvum TaxID=1101404 RepID=A0ABP9QTP0_9RHOO